MTALFNRNIRHFGSYPTDVYLCTPRPPSSSPGEGISKNKVFPSRLSRVAPSLFFHFLFVVFSPSFSSPPRHFLLFARGGPLIRTVNLSCGSLGGETAEFYRVRFTARRHLHPPLRFPEGSLLWIFEPPPLETASHLSFRRKSGTFWTSIGPRYLFSFLISPTVLPKPLFFTS